MDKLLQRYETIPYGPFIHPHTHPSRMGAAAMLAGFIPADPNHARVLELGCGAGVNLLSIAQSLPEAQFLGIDFSESAISDAEAYRSDAGLTNITFRCEDLRNFAGDEEGYDYIIAHGVLSWIPDDAKAALMQICGKCLRPNGLAYIGYNAYPGWKLRQTLRDLILRCFGLESPEDQATHGRKLIKVLATEWEAHPTAASWHYVAEQLLRPDTQFLHDDLGEHNDPLYFMDFLKFAEEHQLRYLTDAAEPLGGFYNFHVAARETADELNLSPAQREQLADFIRIYTQRRSILTRADAPTPARVTSKVVEHLAIGTGLQPKPIAEDSALDYPVEFANQRGGTVKVRDNLASAMLCELAAAWPRRMMLEEIVPAATRSGHAADDPASLQRNFEYLRGIIFNMLSAGLMSAALTTWPGPSSPDIPEKPLIAPLNRVFARRLKKLVDYTLHEIPLSEPYAILCANLDGQQTVADAADAAAIPDLEALNFLNRLWRAGVLHSA